VSLFATATGNLEKTSDLVTNPDGSVLVRAKMKVEVEDQSPVHDIENPTILVDIIAFGENAKSLANLSEAETVSHTLRAGVEKYRDGPEPRARCKVERIHEERPLGQGIRQSGARRN
jgi:hypothetical protein